MGFEVPVSGVDRTPARGGRAVAVTLLALAAIVALAVATGGVPSVGRSVAVTSPNQTIAASPHVPQPFLPRVVPDDVSCRDVGRATCLKIVKAALLALPDDAPDAIDAIVWRSLLCNDTFDCPPSYLEGSAPLGSAIFRFADGSPRAAINVIEGRAGPVGHASRAWVVRWMPEAG